MHNMFEHIKKDFPVLKSGELAYLDTAATSQTPQSVIDAVSDYYTNYRASIHRGLYPIAEKATQEYEKARERVAEFIHAGTDEVIFTAGATASSNMLVYALENTLDLQEGDEIVVSITEHHASLIPLQEFARRKKLVIKHVPLANNFELDYDKAAELITKRTKIVSVMLASNVLGTIHDISKIVELGHKVGAIVISDATAAVGHIPVDVSHLDVDFLYFSGHKICGPTGIGVLYGKKERLNSLYPGFFGGSMIDVVEKDKATWADDVSRFEAGTPNIAGVVGLVATLAYLEDIGGMETIHDFVADLVKYAMQELGKIEGLTMYTMSNAQKNTGIISFTIDGTHPHDIAQIAGQNNVAIRAGHHCAMPLMGELGVSATARMSLYFYNTKDDIDRLILSLKKTIKIFK